MKQLKLITKPSYPRSFKSSATATSDSFKANVSNLAGGIWDELIWDLTIADLKENPQTCLEQNGPQFLYDMLLDALDKLQNSENRLAALRDEFQSYKQTIRSAAH